MKRLAAALIVLGLLSACGSKSTKPPRDLHNACSIKKERRSWYKAMKKTERKWGVPVSVQMSTIYHESKFDGTARTPQKYKLGVIPVGRVSSAYGFSQALNGTWDWYRDSTGRRNAKRSNISDATDFIGWYFDQSNKILGISKSDAYNQYLAYHEGHTGFRKGTYRSKGFLIPYARRVQEKAIVYRNQLANCR